MSELTYAIVGGGPAGYTVAIQLAKQGNDVTLYEKDFIGGTCLNRGCIPTKALLYSSQLYSNISKLEDLGIKVDTSEFDISKIYEKKDNIVLKIRKSLELAIKNSGVKIINNNVDVIDANNLKVDDTIQKYDKIIIATGSKPRELKGLEFDREFILSSDDLLNLKRIPQNILIVGSGAIGIEWARIFSNFGSDVSIVEMAEHLLPIADIEVSKRVERIFKQNKINFYLNNKIAEIENRVVILENGTVLNPDVILVAVGRVPVCSSDSCEVILGDASGEIQLAHYAISQAKQYAEDIIFDKDLIPSVVYGEPEIAWVGKKEQDCDSTYQKAVLPITALGKAWCDDCKDGFMKIITRDNKIVGAHIISPEASSLIHFMLIAIQNNIEIDELKKISFAHPTYAEGVYELLINKKMLIS